jgi:hydroxyacylglutathione hydrolase
MITPLRLSLSNAYLIQGSRAILVDSGSPGEERAIARALGRAGVALSDLALIVQTHGHSDHAGSTRALAALSGAPVAAHPAELARLRSGRNGTIVTTRWRGDLIRPFVDRRFDPVDPEVLLDEGFDLRPYGVEGQVIATPGHTGGSISILLGSGEAIVGDLLMGGHMGGVVQPTLPRLHYFADDRAALMGSLRRVAAVAPSRLYLGHGGPIAGHDAVAFCARHAATEDRRRAG